MLGQQNETTPPEGDSHSSITNDAAGTSSTQNVPKLEVHRVALKLPQFWTQQPEIYFEQIEAMFLTSDIRDTKTKYAYLIQALPSEVAIDVQDVMRKCRQERDPYEIMKQQLISRNTMSDTSRVEQLLSHATMGDRSPSAFYRWMLRTAGTSSGITDDLVKKLWFRQLPSQLEASLRPFADKDMETITKFADEIYEIYKRPHGLSVVEESKKPGAIPKRVDEVAELKAEISELKRAIAQLSTSNSRGRSHSRGRSSSKNRDKSESRLCFFHYKFGDDARKCKGYPCPKASSGTSKNH